MNDFMCKNMLNAFLNLNWKTHQCIAGLIRLVLVLYSVYQDSVSNVNYTDLDYKVFTDAARYVANGTSPYSRSTYRYTPLVAIALLPNIWIHPSFGKILFCIFDLLSAVLIRKLIHHNINVYNEFLTKKEPNPPSAIPIGAYKIRKKSKYLQTNFALCFWLYNPLTIAISTRGSCDAIAVFLILLTLYMLQNRKHIFMSGFCYGISIHFRLYPIIYSFSFLVYLSDFSFYTRFIQATSRKVFMVVERKDTFSNRDYFLLLIPNWQQVKFIFGCTVSFVSLLTGFYYLYGNKFLYETYIYHLIRKDVRHNFSLYFYMQYLSTSIVQLNISLIVLRIVPQLTLLFVFSVHYALNRYSLNFCIALQTIVFVAYNSVLTSQYFVWILGVLPLCTWQIRMPYKQFVFWMALWYFAQGAWLLPAYYLEFESRNTFTFIWMQSIMLFCVHVAILGKLIYYFKVK